ncbi:hypothetical protein [Metabacillus malikii]|uniref:Uncharacterized protein n=1 Tax=Metabacillus malikii TaxID=1504265 RepID=A0ABT9ZAD8_9BACI|nr:hypothetical protein [Metabacillus malikii]MDQ0228801.1 hypothetical protein [Metabacillus malikii]
MNNKEQQNLPDFNELSDRLIAEPSHSPSLVIKTNLDTENVSNENPYIQGKEPSSKFKNFFKE